MTAGPSATPYWDEGRQKRFEPPSAEARFVHPREAINSFRTRYRADEAINGDVMDLIRRLHPHYKLAVLSNSPLGFTHWLAEWKIQKLFDVVFCSGDEGVVKPEGTIFIDDTPEHVEAAGRMGLTEIFSQMRPRFGMPWER